MALPLPWHLFPGPCLSSPGCFTSAPSPPLHIYPHYLWQGIFEGSFQIFKSEPTYAGQTQQKEGYVFSKGAVKLGMGTAECTYSYIKSGDDESMAIPLYDVKKIGRMGLALGFTNQEGTLVAKYAQPGMNVKLNIAEVGANVDYAAIVVVAGIIGAATGSGGASAGALAGAGVV